MSVPHIAVIGAGLAGLACAGALLEQGVDVTLFDAGGAPGGRLGTAGVPPHGFDLGAQYFTARAPDFVARVETWLNAGVCQLWPARIVSLANAATPPCPVAGGERRFVGQPAMSALARHLAARLDLRSSHRVERLVNEGSTLRLFGSIGAASASPPPAGAAEPQHLGAFDRVAVCLPASEAAALVAPSSPALAARARGVVMDPCIAVGWAASDADAPSLRALAFDAAFIGRPGALPARSNSPLTWVARDSSKPGRPPGERWVLHAAPGWSRRHAERPDRELARALISEFASLFEQGPLTPAFSVVQRWALARAPAPLADAVLYDPTAGIGLGGDWARGGRVEGAFSSGRTLAARLLELDIDRDAASK